MAVLWCTGLCLIYPEAQRWTRPALFAVPVDTRQLRAGVAKQRLDAIRQASV